MKSATSANGRTAQAAASGGQSHALTTSYNGGAVMGLAVGGLGLFGISLMFYFTETDFLTVANIAGFGMGASSIALFARVGGGIYTKAADVGADLVGKSRLEYLRMTREILVLLQITLVITLEMLLVWVLISSSLSWVQLLRPW